MTLNNRLQKSFEVQLAGVPGISKDQVFLAGGALLAAIEGEKPKDFDFFFTTEECAAATVAALLKGSGLALQTKQDNIAPTLTIGSLVYKANPFKTAEVIDALNLQLAIEKGGPAKLLQYVSQNAITLKTGTQLIFRFIGEPAAVLSTFDFAHCCIYYSPATKAVLGPEQLRSIALKQLEFTNNTRFVLSALARSAKFVKRGWSLPAHTLVQLVDSAMKVDWSKVETLEKELTGLYGLTNSQVKELTNKLKEKEFSLAKVIEYLGEFEV